LVLSSKGRAAASARRRDYAEGRNESAATTVALDKFDQPIGAVVADCKATPKETLWQKIKRHF